MWGIVWVIVGVVVYFVVMTWACKRFFDVCGRG